MKQLVLLISIVFAIVSCKNESKDRGESAIPVIKIDLKEIESDFVDNLSEVFEPVDIISLETNQQCFIGGVKRIKFYGNDIYIFDEIGAKGLLVFSDDGKFKYRIGNVGKGPGEFLYPKDFDIYKDEIRILDLNKIVVYDLDGKFKKEIQLDFLANYFATVSDNYDVYYGSGREDRIIIANKNGKKISSFYKYSPRNSISGSLIVQRVDSTSFINIPICDTVFAFTRDSLVPFCRIDFGSAAFTNKDYENLPEERKMHTYQFIVESKKFAVKHLLTETEDYQFLILLNDKRPIFGVTSKISGKRQFFNLLECNDDVWNAEAYAMPGLYFNNNKVAIVHSDPTRVLKGWNYLKEKSKSSELSKQEKIVLEQMNRVCENMDEMSNPIILVAKVKI